ncbi:carboxymuconolactone decarboxylase family protein [Egicoccus sp. AB-alg2]|uniref:carboxymuconolactone decarboxylase family protein n=1 Tax=Egicoccus sp. AB-alg2 TaxID=3242693 RepID=UPI00359CE8B8
MDEAPDVEYLPDVYVGIRERYPDVAAALDALGRAGEAAGPLDEREQRLATLGIAIGALAKGAVRSNVRKALGVGCSPDAIRHAAVLAITTAGFPSAVAAMGWIDEVLAEEG